MPSCRSGRERSGNQPRLTDTKAFLNGVPSLKSSPQRDCLCRFQNKACPEQIQNINHNHMTTDTHGTKHKGWIGVDLDGTLAVYHGWVAPDHIGDPIDLMADRVRQWLKEGKEVRIFTARVWPGKDDAAICRRAIEVWCFSVFGQTLPITHEKDPGMLELWDDRCVQVFPNTGRLCVPLLHRLFEGLFRLLCKVGNHDWREGPGGRCRTCGKRDDFFDEPENLGSIPSSGIK